jgi:signal transduction histidine kinase
MASADIVDRLAAMAVFADVPRSELEWLAAHGEARTVETGSPFGDEERVVSEMYVVFSGRSSLYIGDPGNRRKIVESGTGQVLGLLPYSRLKKTPGEIVVEEPMVMWVMHKRHLDQLIRDCPKLTEALVHHMLDRARDYRSAQMADERLQSLGRLASGLAHELNNPASAAARHAHSLPTWLEDSERAATALAGAHLTDAQLKIIEAVRSSCTGPPPVLTALEAADREDDIADWLGGHDLDRVLAEVLAASNVTVPALDRLAEAVPGQALTIATSWVAAACAARAVAHQVETSTTRIHDLVAAIKGFSFMDREGVPEDVDIARGLADTLTMLESKSRAKSIGVQLETAADLPRVHGFGSELNQLWEKLIDNAIDAASTDGRVAITATGRGDSVVVRVSDDGPGIPDDIRARVFDPFFTTKAVGKGTGLGLYLARRVVQFHKGDLEFTSQPGRTVFRVRLPAAHPPGLRALEALGHSH